MVNDELRIDEFQMVNVRLTMVLRDAVGVGAAGEGCAWVGALVVEAGQLAGAVVVLLALGGPGGLAEAAADVGVSLGADRALALVAARPVDADGALLAGVVQALVDVLAAGQRTTGVAGVAQALWRGEMSRWVWEYFDG